MIWYVLLQTIALFGTMALQGIVAYYAYRQYKKIRRGLFTSIEAKLAPIFATKILGIHVYELEKLHSKVLDVLKKELR